jgi:hypothetical protein
MRLGMFQSDQTHWLERLTRVCSGRPIVVYVVLTYAVTWCFLIPFVYLWRGWLDRSFEWWLIIFLP